MLIDHFFNIIVHVSIDHYQPLLNILSSSVDLNHHAIND